MALQADLLDYLTLELNTAPAKGAGTTNPGLYFWLSVQHMDLSLIISLKENLHFHSV